MADVFEIRVAGEADVRALLLQLQANADDMSDVLKLIGQGINEDQRAAIDRGLTPPLSPSYAKRKAEAGKGGEPILVFEGDLYLSFDVEFINSDTISAGSSDPKIGYHASLEPRSVMPFRDPVSIDEEKWGPLIEDLALDGLFRGIRLEAVGGEEDSLVAA